MRKFQIAQQLIDGKSHVPPANPLGPITAVNNYLNLTQAPAPVRTGMFTASGLTQTSYQALVI